jgi:hypothetical protein
MNRITMAAALALATLSTAAVAQSSEEQQACMNDAFRVCSATIPDRARTTACMIQNKSQLSPACQQVMAKYAPAVSPVQTVAAAPVRAKNVSLKAVKPVKTAINQRPGKPLNILMR